MPIRDRLNALWATLKADVRTTSRLVSVHVSLVASVITSAVLANQQLVIQLIDRLGIPSIRDGVIYGIIFLVFLLPSLHCEYSPVPGSSKPENTDAPDQ